jgi:WD40 repeat protein
MIDLSGAGDQRTLRGHTDAVRAIRCHPAGGMFVSASADGTIQLWDLGFGRLGRPLTGHVGEIFALDVSADGRLAVSGGADGSVRLWLLGDWRHWLEVACDRLSLHELGGAHLAVCGEPGTPDT